MASALIDAQNDNGSIWLKSFIVKGDYLSSPTRRQRECHLCQCIASPRRGILKQEPNPVFASAFWVRLETPDRDPD